MVRRTGVESADSASDRGWETLRRELDRSRRYEHALTLVRIGPAEPLRRGRRVAARTRAGVSAEALAAAAAQLRESLRAEDRVWRRGSALFVLLPETDGSAGRALVDRLRGRGPGFLAAAEITSASFPADGLTPEALLAAVLRPSGRAAPASAPAAITAEAAVDPAD